MAAADQSISIAKMVRVTQSESRNQLATRASNNSSRVDGCCGDDRSVCVDNGSD